jgi:acyl-coenzyme A synthetase/AMP-(fatty) acid ligase
MIEKYEITILYTAPTAIRGLMRFGEAWPNRHDLTSLRLLGSVGEPINPEAWKWYHRVIGRGNCPIMDTWRQTETGMFIITPTPAIPLKPGSAPGPTLVLLLKLWILRAMQYPMGKKASWCFLSHGPQCCALFIEILIDTLVSIGVRIQTST